MDDNNNLFDPFSIDFDDLFAVHGNERSDLQVIENLLLQHYQTGELFQLGGIAARFFHENYYFTENLRFHVKHEMESLKRLIDRVNEEIIPNAPELICLYSKSETMSFFRGGIKGPAVTVVSREGLKTTVDRIKLNVVRKLKCTNDVFCT